MHFYINGEQVDVTLENEKTVGDVLKSFEQTCEQNSLTTIAIKLNGSTVPARQFDEASLQPLKEDTKLELTVISAQDVFDSLSSLITPFTDIKTDVENIPILLQSGKDSEVHKTITELADLIDQLCRSVTFSALFPEKLAIIKIGEKTTADFFADFSQILGDFKNALESKDTVTIGDLAEYEIGPRLSEIAETLKELHV